MLGGESIEYQHLRTAKYQSVAPSAGKKVSSWLRTLHSCSDQVPPDVGLAPTPLWRVPPQANCRTLPWSHSPSLSTSPSSLTLFAMLRNFKGVAWAGMVEGAQVGRKGGPTAGTWGQTHIWGHSIRAQEETAAKHSFAGSWHLGTGNACEQLTQK